ncbi:MAG: energy-coupling factor ABC transporter ATP-binding protein [Desulforhopalus sp.]
MLYRLQSVRRVHDGRTVLDIDDLQIESGAIYSLIGPNGAGKTSLLKLLSFLDRPSSGAIYFDDQPVSFEESRLNTLRRRVVLLDQSPIMFTGSVRKNVEFGLKVRRVGQRERRRLVNQALELVGMENFAAYYAPGLSGGETKRVALARALVLQPEVLLCDEPTANVDNENQEIILKIIKQINSEQKRSVIFSTHYLSQSRQLADHSLLLQHGCLSADSGDNSYRATVIDRGEKYRVCQLTGQLFLKLPDHLFSDTKETVRINVDPFSIVLNPDGCSDADGNIVAGHIVELRQDSGRIRLTVNIGVKLVLVLSVKQYRSLRPCIGDRARLFIPNEAITCSKFDHAR